MRNDELERRIFKKARHCQLKRKFHAFISGARYKKTLEVEHSGKSVEADFFSNEFILDLKNIGEIGNLIGKSRVGYCAEIRAVNLVCNVRKIHEYKKIHVGFAIRPRTMQKGKKCQICKSLF